MPIVDRGRRGRYQEALERSFTVTCKLTLFGPKRNTSWRDNIVMDTLQPACIKLKLT